MPGRIFRLVAVSLVVLALLASQAIADKRVALVIGNAGYQHTAPLTNPLNDAADIAAAFRRLGFRVIEGHDLDKLAMDRIVVQFARELTGADAGVLYYAGHGLQVDGQNFLVPIDARLETAAGLEFETVRLDAVHKTMERATRTNILFLDACRDNPLSRNLARALGTRSATIGRGLASVESGEGTLISFSTQPGNVALDGTGRNSPYATALVRQLEAPKDDVSALLIGVRNEVMRETRRRQVPWEHSALTAKFYFVPPEPAAPTAAPAIPLPPMPSYEQQVELAFWAAVKDSRDPRVIQTYLDAYPKGIFAALAGVLAAKIKVEAERERQEAVKAAEEAARKGVDARPVETTVAAMPHLPQPPGAAGPAGVPTGDVESLTRNLQQELKRVGCDPGAVDGKWGPRARSALGEFARRTKVSLAIDDPTEPALAALKMQKGRICPLVCDGDEIERNGTCMPRPQPKAAPAAKSRVVQPVQPAPSAAPPPKSKAVSFPCIFSGRPDTNVKDCGP